MKFDKLKFDKSVIVFLFERIGKHNFYKSYQFFSEEVKFVPLPLVKIDSFTVICHEFETETKKTKKIKLHNYPLSDIGVII